MGIQMTIYDFLTPDEDYNLYDLPEDEMVRIISDATGLDFKYKDGLWGYIAKVGKVQYELKYSNYKQINNHARFISCGYGNNKEGAGSPCNSVKEAIAFFKKYLGKGVL